MASLETNYMGLKLKNPIIVGSSGLTNSVENIIEIAKEGAGAVVLKSLFEEQLNMTANRTFEQGDFSNYYPEALDYIQNYSSENDVANYLNLIKACKASVDIPIIASINCMTDNEWVNFAKKIEDAGADGLELNVFVLPSDPNKSSKDNEKVYFDIVEKVTNIVNIPVALKLSYYFSGLAKTMEMLSWTSIKSLVLFNRFFSPDIDINNFEIKSSNIFSTPSDLAQSLRWVAMLSANIKCDIAASTGVHDGKAVIKQLLAGATTVQIASVLYKKGFKEIPIMLREINNWMSEKNFDTIEQFRGKMSFKQSNNPAAYERVQFMKYFSGIE
ncbi:MAG: dihydroorotate dehydrogenase-like protein [Bacteroidetes bacterium]|nr:dihydroorotate dehydrogenase-like protein [Bacteroidota bacterium]MBL6943634.1 dihydroorotate dehydrogenase-like protein [Bacteroidales bacterium]